MCPTAGRRLPGSLRAGCRNPARCRRAPVGFLRDRGVHGAGFAFAGPVADPHSSAGVGGQGDPACLAEAADVMPAGRETRGWRRRAVRGSR
jgi:hypothetical protein